MSEANGTSEAGKEAPINAGRLKHLEMIQAVITRMANNSFLIKGWSVTLLAAILALAVKDDAHAMVLVAFLPNLMFWLLDAFFLRQERLYRALWNLKRGEPQHQATDFDLNAAGLDDKVASWLGTACSRTLLLFHGCLFGILLVFSVVLLCKVL